MNMWNFIPDRILNLQIYLQYLPVKNSWCSIQEMILLKWNKPKARIWPYCIFSGTISHINILKNRTPAISLATSQEFGPNPRWVWVHTSKNCQPWISCKHWVWGHDTFASSSWGLVDPSKMVYEGKSHEHGWFGGSLQFRKPMETSKKTHVEKGSHGIPATKRDPLNSRAWTVTCLVHTQPGSWEVGPWLKDLIWR